MSLESRWSQNDDADLARFRQGIRPNEPFSRLSHDEDDDPITHGQQIAVRRTSFNGPELVSARCIDGLQRAGRGLQTPPRRRPRQRRKCPRRRHDHDVVGLADRALAWLDPPPLDACADVDDERWTFYIRRRGERSRSRSTTNTASSLGHDAGSAVRSTCRSLVEELEELSSELRTHFAAGNRHPIEGVQRQRHPPAQRQLGEHPTGLIGGMSSGSPAAGRSMRVSVPM